jgi:predicted Zn-dependent peptidase
MYRLESFANGLRVAAAEMPARDSIAVGIWVRVGGRYERPSLSGIAHFTEHLLFKGTKSRSAREIKEAIEGRGGVFNAFTGEESTCYFVKILKRHFKLSLEVLSDMAKHSLFRPAEIERERTVILEEIKMYQDQPSQIVQERMNELLWPGQPLGRFLAGTVESVARMRRSDFLAFHRRYYHPRNLVITVCGDLPGGEVLEAVRKQFPQAGDGRLSQFSRADSRQAKPRYDFFKKETEQMHVVVGFHALSRRHPDRFKFGLLNVVLGGNMSSRLFEEVREKRGLAYEIKSGLSLHQDTGAFLISEGVERKKLTHSIAVILKEIRKIRAKPVGAEELRRAKDYYLGQLYLAIEDTLDHMLWFGEKAMYLGRIPSRDEIRAEVEKITAGDLQGLARRYLSTGNLNLAVVGPTDKKLEAGIRKNFLIE